MIARVSKYALTGALIGLAAALPNLGYGNDEYPDQTTPYYPQGTAPTFSEYPNGVPPTDYSGPPVTYNDVVTYTHTIAMTSTVPCAPYTSNGYVYSNIASEYYTTAVESNNVVRTKGCDEYGHCYGSSDPTPAPHYHDDDDDHYDTPDWNGYGKGRDHKGYSRGGRHYNDYDHDGHSKGYGHGRDNYVPPHKYVTKYGMTPYGCDHDGNYYYIDDDGKPYYVDKSDKIVYVSYSSDKPYYYDEGLKVSYYVDKDAGTAYKVDNHGSKVYIKKNMYGTDYAKKIQHRYARVLRPNKHRAGKITYVPPYEFEPKYGMCSYGYDRVGNTYYIDNHGKPFYVNNDGKKVYVKRVAAHKPYYVDQKKNIAYYVDEKAGTAYYIDKSGSRVYITKALYGEDYAKKMRAQYAHVLNRQKNKHAGGVVYITITKTITEYPETSTSEATYPSSTSSYDKYGKYGADTITKEDKYTSTPLPYSY